MGRPKQTGFEFFPFDSSFFEDIKVRKLIRGGCINATTVYISALCFVFKEGYYLRIDEDFPFLIYEKTGIAEEEVAKCIDKCVEVGLFDKSLYEQGILTSIGIQKRYQKICSQCRRAISITEYNLLDDGICKANNCGGNDVSTEVSSEETIEQDIFSAEEMQQSKVKENKVDIPPISNEIVPPANSSEDSSKLPAKPLTLEERKHEFGLALVPYVEKYGPEMIREFFDYWTEHNDGGKKMRWEIAKTRGGVFSIPGRLATWKKKSEEGFGHRSQKRGSTISEAVQATAIPEGGIGGQLDITKLLGQ